MTSRDVALDGPAYVTAEGFKKVKEELEFLRTIKRAEVAELIQRAKELGDITDSAQYDAAKNEQAFLEGRIRQLEDTVSRAEIIDAEGSPDGKVRVGSRVTVREGDAAEEETWVIVGRAEADATKGRISNESPVGKALLGKRGGDSVNVITPGGTMRFSVTSVG
ncbi:MAG: transcription elongation factor GreA [Chloroflexi bacterium]|nr:transcription elongation factor GreA [Chloroflexota bacterium]